MALIVKVAVVLSVFLFNYNQVRAETGNLSVLQFDFEPWGYLEDGKPTGVFVEFLEALSKESGVPIDIKIVPYARMRALLQKGLSDFAIFSPNGLDENEYISVAPVYKIKFVVVARGRDLTAYEQLIGETVGVPRGARLGHRFDDDTRIVKRQITNYKQGIKLLRHNRLTYLAGSELTILNEVWKSKLPLRQFGKRLKLNYIVTAIQFSKLSENKWAIPEISKAAKRLFSEGFIENSIKKHFPEEVIDEVRSF